MGTGISNFIVQFMPLFRRKDEYEEKQAQKKKDKEGNTENARQQNWRNTI